MPTPAEMGLPNTYDLQRFQDIHLSDDEFRKEYISEYQSGSINAAHSIINNDPQAQSKALTASRIKAYTDAIIDLESKTIQEGTNTLDEMLEIFQANIDNFEFYDSWVLGQEYKQGNFVFDQFGNLYMALKDGVYELSDSTAWLYLGLRGDPGNLGFGLNYNGQWDSETTYQPKDMVVYQNGLYVSKTQNKDITPGSSPTDWCVALTIEERGIFVSDTEPEDIRTGDYWWVIQPAIDWPVYPPPYIPTEDDFNVAYLKFNALNQWNSLNTWDFTSCVGGWPETLAFSLKNKSDNSITNYIAQKMPGWYLTDVAENPLVSQYRAVVTYYCILNKYLKLEDYDVIVPDNTTDLLTSTYFPEGKVEGSQSEKILSYNLKDEPYANFSATAKKEITSGFSPDEFFFSLPAFISDFAVREYSIEESNDKTYMLVQMDNGKNYDRIKNTNNTDLKSYKTLSTTCVSDYQFEDTTLNLSNEPGFRSNYLFNIVYMYPGWVFPNTTPVTDDMLNTWFNGAPQTITINLIDMKTGDIIEGNIEASKDSTWTKIDNFTYTIRYKTDVLDTLYGRYMVFPYYTEETLNSLSTYSLKLMTMVKVPSLIDEPSYGGEYTYSGYALDVKWPYEPEEIINQVDITYKHWVENSEEASSFISSIPNKFTFDPQKESLYLYYYTNANGSTRQSLNIPSLEFAKNILGDSILGQGDSSILGRMTVEGNGEADEATFPKMIYCTYRYTLPESISGFNFSVDYGSQTSYAYQNNRLMEPYKASFDHLEVSHNGVLTNDEFNLVNIYPRTQEFTNAYWSTLNIANMVSKLPATLTFQLKNTSTQQVTDYEFIKRRGYRNLSSNDGMVNHDKAECCYYCVLSDVKAKTDYTVVFPEETVTALNNAGFLVDYTGDVYQFGAVYEKDIGEEFNIVIGADDVLSEPNYNNRTVSALNSYFTLQPRNFVKELGADNFVMEYLTVSPLTYVMNTNNTNISYNISELLFDLYTDDSTVYNKITLVIKDTQSHTAEEFEEIYNNLPETLSLDIVDFVDSSQVIDTINVTKDHYTSNFVYYVYDYRDMAGDMILGKGLINPGNAYKNKSLLYRVPTISTETQNIITENGFRVSSFETSYDVPPSTEVGQLNNAGNEYCKLITDSSFDVDAWFNSLPEKSIEYWFYINYIDESGQKKSITRGLNKGAMSEYETTPDVPYVLYFTYGANLTESDMNITGTDFSASDGNPTWITSYGCILQNSYLGTLPVNSEEETGSANHITLEFSKVLPDSSQSYDQFVESLPSEIQCTIIYKDLDGYNQPIQNVSFINNTGVPEETIYPCTVYIIYEANLEGAFDYTEISADLDTISPSLDSYGVTFEKITADNNTDIPGEEGEEPGEELVTNELTVIEYYFQKDMPGKTDDEMNSFYESLPSTLGRFQISYVTPEGETQTLMINITKLSKELEGSSIIVNYYYNFKETIYYTSFDFGESAISELVSPYGLELIDIITPVG